MQTKHKIENGTVTLTLADYIVLKKDSEDLNKLLKGISTETVPVVYHEWQYMGATNGDILIISKDEAIIKLQDRIKELEKNFIEHWNVLNGTESTIPTKKWYQIWI